MACPCFDGMVYTCCTLLGTAVQVSTVWFVLPVLLSHAVPSCAARVISRTVQAGGTAGLRIWQLVALCTQRYRAAHSTHTGVPSREPLLHLHTQVAVHMHMQIGAGAAPVAPGCMIAVLCRLVLATGFQLHIHGKACIQSRESRGHTVGAVAVLAGSSSSPEP